MGLFGESDGERAKRYFKEAAEAHAKHVGDFRVEAARAGFTLIQIDLMVKFLALSEHTHQYYHGMHWNISSPPVDGRFEDRER
jgi:hypothetical protein